MGESVKRFCLALALGLAMVGLPAAARCADAVVVDRDDDDGDGVPDGEQGAVLHHVDLVSLPVERGVRGGRVSLGPGVRLFADGRPVSDGQNVPPGTKWLGLQATAPGALTAVVGTSHVELSAIAVWALDGRGGDVDLTRSRASFERWEPRRLPDDPLAPDTDPDALRVVLVGSPDALPAAVDILSLREDGVLVGALRSVAAAPMTCPPVITVDPALACVSTIPIRVVIDAIDAGHPLVAERSLVGALGGALVIAREGAEAPSAGRGALHVRPSFEVSGKLQMIRVGAPRLPEFAGLPRMRAALRVRLVRLSPGGAPPIGGDDEGAVATARRAVRRASQLWWGCGIDFGPPEALDVAVVDPPPAHLLVLGCEGGLPTQGGGGIRFRVQGMSVDVALPAGLLPAEAARRVALRLAELGLRAQIGDHAPAASAAYGSSDVSVRLASGDLADLEPPASGPVSTDRALGACIGQVNLDDGLQHFSDNDASVGTVEERALLGAYDDGDPRTIELVVVPGFGRGGRIGESFIGSDLGSLANAIVVDRGGLLASRSSSTVGHELGHVLLDDPGHPDDFGSDTSTLLMDADAASPSAFGPRRLGLEECRRVLYQSGPAAPAPLLVAVPLRPLGAPP